MREEQMSDNGIQRMPVVFVSHGAATVTMDPAEKSFSKFREIRSALQGVTSKAIVLVSAHDVRPQFTVASAPRMEMLQDHPAGAGQH